ncbi:hypothetical protein U9M48_028910 [Paspalum notatum var. saurae]|uniref:FAS1 domain-containing protein n=1 Tax=Paspalum notatum var. saurae TaxID=547442 RepID=A0AAQ3TY85_PASNO
MPLARVVAAATAVLLLVLGTSPSSCHGASTHNITEILAKRSDFTEFSAALSSTSAAAEIDGHQTVTVLAVNNTVMAQLKALQLQPKDLQRVIYLQVLFDYFDAAKLRSIQESPVHVTSLYQASGKAQGSAGMEDVTVLRGGRVAFSLSDHPSDAPPPPAAFYQKSILETPYDIAVLQVSALVGAPAPTLPLAPAPASPPAHATAAAAPAPAPASSSSPSHAPAAPAPAPASSSSPPHAPAAAAPAPVSSPPAPALAPVVAPASPPTPRRRPAPSPEADTPAPAPDADNQPPADQKNNGARDTASWSLGAAAIVLLLW